MKFITLTLILILFLPTWLRAQVSDTALIKKLVINGYCLCETTLTILKQVNADLKPVNLEEMDSPVKCLGQDSRYITGTGYATEKQPGIIFQKDPRSDFISKIRLTRKFKGNLPDGRFIDLTNFLLKDLFNLYPKFKGKWGSRGCSDYWHFSNDTVSFDVKIDSTKQPQFPIDETYYLNKPVEGIDIVMSCYSTQDKPLAIIDDSNDPVFFVDSVRVNKDMLQKYNPNEIATVTVYKDSRAVYRMGAAAKNGLIYIETKQFARNRYWNYLAFISQLNPNELCL